MSLIAATRLLVASSIYEATLIKIVFVFSEASNSMLQPDTGQPRSNLSIWNTWRQSSSPAFTIFQNNNKRVDMRQKDSLQNDNFVSVETKELP